MVLGSNGNVFHSSRFGESHYFFGIKLSGIKKRGQQFVSINWDALIVHYPFCITQNTVNAPMDKHTKLGVLKPRPGFQIFLRGLIVFLGHGVLAYQKTDDKDGDIFHFGYGVIQIFLKNSIY
jgi:hypothetical protein